MTAGNPLLDPYRAKAYDLSFEWYFAKDALLSLALFKKDIDSFVQIIRSSDSFSNNTLGLPDSVALAACGTAIPDPATCLAGWQFVAADQHRRRRPEGLRDQLSTAVLVPAGLLESLRLDPELHRRRSRRSNTCRQPVRSRPRTISPACRSRPTTPRCTGKTRSSARACRRLIAMTS